MESLWAGGPGWRCGQCRFELVTKACAQCGACFVMPKAGAKAVTTCDECDLGRGSRGAAACQQPVVAVEKNRSSVKELLMLSKMQSLNGKLFFFAGAIPHVKFSMRFSGKIHPKKNKLTRKE